MSTPTPCQLPGVKGQWIKASDCPPTAEWADEDGDVHVYDSSDWGFRQLDDIDPSEYWLPACWDDHLKEDPRPLSLQPATTERRIVQLIVHSSGQAIYAVADDGTAWVSSEERPDWNQMAALPPRDA